MYAKFRRTTWKKNKKSDNNGQYFQRSASEGKPKKTRIYPSLIKLSAAHSGRHSTKQSLQFTDIYLHFLIARLLAATEAGGAVAASRNCNIRNRVEWTIVCIPDVCNCLCFDSVTESFLLTVKKKLTLPQAWNLVSELNSIEIFPNVNIVINF